MPRVLSEVHESYQSNDPSCQANLASSPGGWSSPLKYRPLSIKPWDAQLASQAWAQSWGCRTVDRWSRDGAQW